MYIDYQYHLPIIKSNKMFRIVYNHLQLKAKVIVMLEEICEKLESVQMTALSGVMILLSFIMSTMEIAIPIDPAWISVIISGLPILYEAIERLIERSGITKISSPLLISTALIAALMIGDVFAAGEVAFIMALGEMLEDMTTDRARIGLEKLIKLAPQQGRRIINSEAEIIPLDDIRVNDVLRILPGETIPIDGVIISGTSSVDQSIMTGESLPIDKSVGDEVFGGTINRFGSIDIKATKLNEDSSLQKLIRMVKDAESKKAPMQRIADKWASYLVPLAMIIAIVAYFVTGDIIRAVTVLIVFCPCALVLATPTAIMAAIGQATKHGIIIKSGEALEKMGKTDIVAFDKTGTLTFGKLDVTDVIATSDLNNEDLLKLTASAESRSEHPLGKAITNRATKSAVSLIEVGSFLMQSGKGIKAVVEGREVFCGSEKYLLENGVSINSKSKETIEELRNQGKVSVLTAVDGKHVGIIALSDVIRPASKSMMTSLKDMKTQAVLLTGDNQQTAKYFASRAGIDNIKAELLPEDKVNSIFELQQQGHTVCMIGDGVNDAPALKTADVGIAMGSMGSDIAIDAADIALMNDDISKIPYLKRLANATIKTIKFGISLSLLINFIAIIMSLEGLLTPVTGALVHNGGSFLVIMIAALLYDRNFEEQSDSNKNVNNTTDYIREL
ncbi:MAG: cation-translocating P-type ATPase [Selenomonadaceae bacterium]|nr:cation-translocating P-type ATPase [Selenomonadaceae bacterium]